MPEKEYKISSRNSTVNGNPGRDYNWSYFCWDGDEVFIDDCGHPGHPKEELKAPLPFTDGSSFAPNCQYLHVPYNWANQAQIFRVRPNDTMWAGKFYRGYLIKKQTAVKKEDGWYWVLEFE